MKRACEGVSNLFDKVDKQVKTNTRNIIHQNTDFKNLEESLLNRIVALEKQISTQDHDTLSKLQESVTDLQCRFMKNNLIFTDLAEQPTEDVERKLRAFIQEQLGIEHL